MQNLPIPDAIKRALGNTMEFCFKPILNDHSVLAMMFLMVIFSQDDAGFDPEVASMLSQYWTMLRRHLTNLMGGDTEETIAYLSNCLDKLPSLLQDNSEAFENII